MSSPPDPPPTPPPVPQPPPIPAAQPQVHQPPPQPPPYAPPHQAPPYRPPATQSVDIFHEESAPTLFEPRPIGFFMMAFFGALTPVLLIGGIAFIISRAVDSEREGFQALFVALSPFLGAGIAFVAAVIGHFLFRRSTLLKILVPTLLFLLFAVVPEILIYVFWDEMR